MLRRMYSRRQVLETNELSDAAVPQATDVVAVPPDAAAGEGR